jgi:curved DNA-binding protein CbpA
MQGSLSPGVLPGLLRDLYVGRRSGTAHFSRGEERRSVRFHRGHITNAATSVESDRLGDTLVRLGKLSAADLGRCLELMAREKKRLGQALQELGLMDKQQVEEALALHVREILLAVFAWDEGSYNFEEGSELIGDEEIVQGLSTGEMILEAVQQVEDADVVRYALGDVNRVVALSTDPLLRFQKIKLSPVDGFLLSRVDGTLSAQQVIDLAPVTPEEAEKSLFGLLCTGTVEYLPGPPKPPAKKDPTGRFRLRKDAGKFKAPKPASPQPPPAPAASAPTPTPPPPPPPPPAPAPTAPTPGPAEREKAIEARRQEILEMAEGLKAKTHFEVLGIPRASTEAQVKEAYFKLAKRYHPDTQHEPALKDLASQLEAVFIRIGEAYEVLRNARSRASYEERLGPSRGGGPSVAAGPSSPGQAPAAAAPAASPAAPAPPQQPQPKDAETSARVIELAIRQAERALLQEKYWDVIQLIEPHLAEAKGKLKVRAQIVIAKAYVKNPNWLKRAEEELQKVVHADAANFDAYYLLGAIYKSTGLKARAASMYRKALEIRPDSEESAAALTELGVGPAEPPPAPPGGGSFLKKLFKKS